MFWLYLDKDINMDCHYNFAKITNQTVAEDFCTEHGCCFLFTISVWILMYACSHCPAEQSTYDHVSAS